MSGSNGSSRLTVDQQEWFLRRFGVRYLHVQTDAYTPPRRLRRKLRRRKVAAR